MATFQGKNRETVGKRYSGSSEEEKLIDLLTDLMHLARDQTISFERCLRLVRRHFEHESEREK